MSKEEEKRISRKVCYAMISMGLHPFCQGFKYFKEAIIAYGTTDVTLSEVYRAINEKYGVTDSWRDRSMRSCLAAANKKQITDKVNAIAGATVFSSERKITNKYFVSVMSELVRFEKFVDFGQPSGLKESKLRKTRKGGAA